MLARSLLKMTWFLLNLIFFYRLWVMKMLILETEITIVTHHLDNTIHHSSFTLGWIRILYLALILVMRLETPRH